MEITMNAKHATLKYLTIRNYHHQDKSQSGEDICSTDAFTKTWIQKT